MATAQSKTPKLLFKLNAQFSKETLTEISVLAFQKTLGFTFINYLESNLTHPILIPRAQ